VLAALWDTTSEDRRFVRAAALAALGESGVLFLPLAVLARESAHPSGGPLASYPLFVAAFVAAVALATAFRRSARLAPTAIGVALVVGLVQSRLGPASVHATASSVVLCLVVALRVVSLAIRDWRDPITGSFGWGAGALLVEILLATSVRPRWDAMLPVVVPVFFLASLASRAASVRLTGRMGYGETSDARRWLRLAEVIAGSLAVIMALAALAGGRGGALQALGGVFGPMVAAVVSVLAFVLAQLIRPLIWLAGLFHFDPKGFRSFLARLRAGGGRAQIRHALSAHGGAGRLLGLAMLVLVAVLIAYAIGRRRRKLRDALTSDEARFFVESRPMEAGQRRARRAKPARRELPEDTIRRWYAETLLLLEARGLAKSAPETPGEFLRRVAPAYPGSTSALTALTRAYEDVRYGSRVFDRASIERLGLQRDLVAHLLERAEPPAEASAGGPAENGP
jgi:hypothetical protein